MNNSRTSTNKKTNNKNNIRRKTSASPSNVKPKKKKNVKKQVVSKNSNIVKKVDKSRNVNNNIRLNKGANVDALYQDYDEEIIENKHISNSKQNQNKVVDKQKKKKRAFSVLKFTFFIAIIIAIGYLMFNLETFNLSDISVNGNTKYDQNTIIKESGLKIGENVFMQLLTSRVKKLDLAYVSSYKYKYNFPNSVTIEVHERYPMYIALDKNTSKYYKIDNEGFLLEECDLSQREDELIVEGFAFGEDAKTGNKINDVYISKLEVYNKLKELLDEKQIVTNITKVNFENSLTTLTLDGKLRVVFANNTDLDYKVTLLKEIIQKNGGITNGTINMSIDKPVYSNIE